MPLYIELLHGRTFVGEDDDGNFRWEQLTHWGTDGPVFGPFNFVHSTYRVHLLLGEKCELQAVDDLVFYDGIGYGDFSVFDEMTFQTRVGLAERLRDWERRKADVSTLSQSYVLLLEDDEPDCPLYLSQDRESDYPRPSWTADIDFATPFTLQKVREVAESELRDIDEPFRLHIRKLQFKPFRNKIVRCDHTTYIETVK